MRRRGITASLSMLTMALTLTALRPITAASSPLPLKVGQDYRQARAQLLQAGWRQQAQARGRDCPQGLEDQRCRLFPELGACQQTGLGLCRFNWRTPDGRKAAVITQGGDTLGNPGKVSAWFYE